MFSVFYMCVDTVTWWLGERYRRLAAWALYPMVVVLTWAFWAGPGDLLATAGTALAIAARQQRTVWRIQAFIGASTCCWGIYGYLVDSWPQVAFSAVYGAAAVFNAIRFRTRAPARTPRAAERGL